MSRKANKIFDKMNQGNYFGWRSTDFHTLFVGFGYNVTHGSKHDIYIHPDFKHVAELRMTIPRHPGDLGPGYARKAVQAIRLLQRLKSEKG